MKTILKSKNKTHFPFSALLSFALFFLSGYSSSGQTIITSGTTLKVISGTSLTMTNQLTIQSGAALNNEGTAIFKGNLVNQNVGNNWVGTGTAMFSGTSTQTMSGQNVIQNLNLSNPAGLNIAGNTTVNGTLTLTSGVASLGNFNLSLGLAATVSGSPSSANMIAPNGAGQLQKMFTSAGSFTFPAGDATGTPEYSPVTVAFNSGTFSENSYVGVNLTDAQYPGTAGSYLTRYWNVAQSGITDYACNATFQYPVADVAGVESDIFSFKVSATPPWTAYNAATPANHQLTVHGLSSFGTFTGNLGDATTPPDIRSLQDKTIGNGMITCADATQTMIIAGNGTYYLVQNGGNVKHIAGQNIIYYPGTKVEAGGYLHGYISTTFCNPYAHPGAAPVVAGVEETPGRNSDNGFFKVYPNPTPGNFTLELRGDITTSQVHVDIIGILGERILSKDIFLNNKQEFSLTDRPSGVYVIHVTSGTNSETEKIIRQ